MIKVKVKKRADGLHDRAAQSQIKKPRS